MGRVCFVLPITGAPSMPRYLLLLLALLLLSACSSTPRFASQDLQHHHWVLDRLDGQTVTGSRVNPPISRSGSTSPSTASPAATATSARVTSRGTGSGSPASAAPPWPALRLDQVEQAVPRHPDGGATLSGSTQTLILQGKTAPFGIQAARLGVPGGRRNQIRYRNNWPGCGTI